jgi:hypothetical protein
LAQEHGIHTLDIGYYSSEARTSINPVVSRANHPSPTHVDINLLPALENPDRQPRPGWAAESTGAVGMWWGGGALKGVAGMVGNAPGVGWVGDKVGPVTAGRDGDGGQHGGDGIRWEPF